MQRTNTNLKFIWQSGKVSLSYPDYYKLFSWATLFAIQTLLETWHKNLIWHFIVMTYLYFLKHLIKYIPFFLFSIIRAQMHSTICSDLIWLCWHGRILLFEYLNIKFRALFSSNCNPGIKQRICSIVLPI